MTKVAILPVPASQGGVRYQAVSGQKRSEGRTVGEALDALTDQFSEDSPGTLVIVQKFQADQFFNAEQQRRLAELMDRWRAARDQGMDLVSSEQSELEALIDLELQSSGDRAADIHFELSR